MKQITIILALLISSATYAQNTLSHQTNSLRQDSVGMEVINFLDPGCSGQNVLWNFSDIVPQDDKRCSIQLYALPDRLLWDESGSLVTYQPSADSLLISRIETPLYEMDYSQPIVSLVYPFSYGSSLSAPFSGTGDYEGKLALAEVGINNVTADAIGALVLAEGDTLWNVLRVCTQRNADVTITGIVGGEDFGTLQKATDIYEWYARGYRYPVLRTIEERISKEGSLLRTVQYAHSITPEEQEQLEDNVNEDIRTNDSIAYAASNPVRNLHVANNGSSATVTYDLAADAHISITLANSQGMLFWRYDANEEAGEEHSHTIPLTGLQRGQYIIYLNANGQVYSSKINVE